MKPERRDADPSRERFDRWSESYEESFMWNHFFSPLHELVAGRIGDLSGLSVLDIGCGTGGLLRSLAGSGASRLVGIDLSSGMLNVARGLAGTANIDFIEASAGEIPVPDRSFDVVTSCIAFHHFPDPSGVVREIERVLKSQGRLLLCDMCGEGLAAKIMLAYGSRVGHDNRYLERSEIKGLARDAGLEVQNAEVVHRFPKVMLVEARKR